MLCYYVPQFNFFFLIIEIVLFSEFSPLCLSWQICSIWSRYSAFFTLVLAVPLERPLAFPIKFCQMAVAFWRTLHFILFHYIFKVSKYSTNSFFCVLHEFRQKIIKATYKIRRFFKDLRNLKTLYFFYYFAIIEKITYSATKKKSEKCMPKLSSCLVRTQGMWFIPN